MEKDRQMNKRSPIPKKSIQTKWYVYIFLLLEIKEGKNDIDGIMKPRPFIPRGKMNEKC